MNAQNMNQILDALAARLAVPAAHLWAVLIRQAYVEFTTMTIGVLFAWTVAAQLLRVWKRERAKPKERYYGDDSEMWLGIAAVIVSVIALGMTFVWIGEISYVINPEYYALHEILGAVK